MRGNEMLNAMGYVDTELIEKAERKQIKGKKNRIKKWGALVACLCLVFTLAVPALAATIPAFYDILYTISPATAQFFKPVQLSCEVDGIRMEVVSAYVHEDTVEIYISMQDLTGTRFGDSVDLFDSYQINTPFDCTSFCNPVSCDPDTQTATFLITVEQWKEKNIIGDKLTFTVREFLSNKNTSDDIIRGVNLGEIVLNTETQTVYPRGLSGVEIINRYSKTTREPLVVLKPAGSIATPLDGVTITAIGYVDNYLHVQVYYDNIMKTDNHGSLALISKDGGEMIKCDGTISFFDKEKQCSYESYLFSDVPEDILDNYELYGEFTTSPGSVEGYWSVTFPLENIQAK